MKLIGPRKQISTLANLSLRGKLSDNKLEIIEQGWILIENNLIKKVGKYADFLNGVMLSEVEASQFKIEKSDNEQICLPSFVDSHTHILFGGNRSNDFAIRNAVTTYLEIAEHGGGIWSDVLHTREHTKDTLMKIWFQRIQII